MAPGRQTSVGSEALPSLSSVRGIALMSALDSVSLIRCTRNQALLRTALRNSAATNDAKIPAMLGHVRILRSLMSAAFRPCRSIARWPMGARRHEAAREIFFSLLFRRGEVFARGAHLVLTALICGSFSGGETRGNRAFTRALLLALRGFLFDALRLQQRNLLVGIRDAIVFGERLHQITRCTADIIALRDPPADIFDRLFDARVRPRAEALADQRELLVRQAELLVKRQIERCGRAHVRIGGRCFFLAFEPEGDLILLARTRRACARLVGDLDIRNSLICLTAGSR